MGDVVRMVGLPDSVVQVLQESSQREGITLAKLLERMAIECALIDESTNQAVGVRLWLEPQGYQDIREVADNLSKPLGETVKQLLNLGIWLHKTQASTKRILVEEDGKLREVKFD